MHLAVNNCGHILGSNECHPARGMAHLIALSYSGYHFISIALLLVLMLCMVQGCSSSSKSLSPRFEIKKADTLSQTSAVEDASDTSDESAEDEIINENSEEVFLPRTADINFVREANAAIDRHAVLTTIMSFMGARYRKRGSDSNGFDCSGYTMNIYQSALNIELPRSVREQYKIGNAVIKDSLMLMARKKCPSSMGTLCPSLTPVRAFMKLPVCSADERSSTSVAYP